MLRLIFADLVQNARVWVGAFIVSVCTGAVGSVAASFIETGNSLGGKTQENLASTSSVVIVFSSIAALVVVSSIANLTVSLQQRGYALWQLVGIRPGLIGVVVLCQLGIVALGGALLGCILAAPFLQPFFDFLFTSWNGMSGVTLVFSPVSMAWVVGIVVATTLLSGLRGARRASRVPAIEALQEPAPPRLRIGWLRWLVAAGAIAGTVALSNDLLSSDFQGIGQRSMLLTPLIAASIATLGPLLFPVVLGGWTALVPSQASSSWFLARNSARYRLSQSTAAISPLLVAVALAGGLYTTGGTLGNADTILTGRIDSFAMPIEPTILMLGGPLLLSAVGAAVTVFMSSRAREREFALVQATGGTHATIAAAAAWEAVIYVTTATLLGLAAVTAGGVVVAVALAKTVPGVLPSFGFSTTLVIAGVGLLLMLAATVLPSVAALRHEVPRTLAVE